MSNQRRSDFLRQSYEDSWSDYQYMLQHTRTTRWDWFVVTASNEEQAEAYRIQIDYRLRNGWLPKGTRYVVIPDPDGKRVGSGGATLNVLRHIEQSSSGRDPFTDQRIVILHSGGDSKRVPQYSACGKLFSKVPRQLPDGRSSTLFDEFVISLSGVPSRMSDGLLVLSGDVLLLFNPLQIDLQREGSACISFKAPVETGSHHGVFLSDGLGRVRSFLHKQPVRSLHDAGAVNDQGNVDIDTGAIWMGSRLLRDIMRLVSGPDGTISDKFDGFVNEKVRLSFYGDFAYPMATDATLEEYLREPAEGTACEELLACRRALFPVLNGSPMKLIRLTPAEFIHFGTTRELMSLMSGASDQYDFLKWSSQVMSTGSTDAALFNALVEPNAQVGDESYVEDSRITAGSVIGRGCMVSNTFFSGSLPDNVSMHTLPVHHPENGTGFVVRIYGTDDNPKVALSESSLFSDLFRHLTNQGDGLALDGATLWDAPLYVVGRSQQDALDAAWSLLRIADGSADVEECGRWRNAPRMSLQESFSRASMRHVLDWQLELEDRIRLDRFTTLMEAGTYYLEASSGLGGGEALQRRLDLLAAEISGKSFVLHYRLCLALSRLCRENRMDAGGTDADEWENRCYQTINDEFQKVCFAEPMNPDIPLWFVTDHVECALPVRVNWGGGWSDTPPYCFEHGGTVLNAALRLRGELPIQVRVERLNDPLIILECADSGLRSEYLELSPLQQYRNPSDPFALHKAALVAAQIIPPAGSTMDLHRALESAGGGLLIRTDVNVPKGSGLGTSSILSGAVLTALLEMTGRNVEQQDLFQRVLYLEQLMTSGGGWQDQVGGILPGIKFIRSAAGLEQKLKVRNLELSDEMRKLLDERFALVFTGQRRLARNLLREITGKYIVGTPETRFILERIQHIALMMAFELERGAFESFLGFLNEHWELSVRLDAGSTNTFINQIIEVCRPLVDGVFIAGAGGGGFLQMIMKPGITRAILSDRLNEVYQDSGIAVWDTSFVW